MYIVKLLNLQYIVDKAISVKNVDGLDHVVSANFAAENPSTHGEAVHEPRQQGDKSRNGQ
jgi:hypothetical protein